MTSHVTERVAKALAEAIDGVGEKEWPEQGETYREEMRAGARAALRIVTSHVTHEDEGIVSEREVRKARGDIGWEG